MELLGFLLGAIAVAFVIAKVIFSSKAKTPPSKDPPEDKGNDDTRSGCISWPTQSSNGEQLPIPRH